MNNYRKSKQHIEGIQKQKINTETRCAKQRKQLALMNTQIKNYKELFKECREILEDITEHTDYNEVGIENIITKINNIIREKK